MTIGWWVDRCSYWKLYFSVSELSWKSKCMCFSGILSPKKRKIWVSGVTSLFPLRSQSPQGAPQLPRHVLPQRPWPAVLQGLSTSVAWQCSRPPRCLQPCAACRTVPSPWDGVPPGRSCGDEGEWKCTELWNSPKNEKFIRRR